jgi:hypothetical protein
MVTLASATLVATMTFRSPSSAGWKTANCSALGSPAYSGSALSFGVEGFICPRREAISATHRSISSLPVKKSNISPSGS